MFLVQCPAAREFVQTSFELDIAFEEFVFGTHADSLPEGLARHSEVRLPDFKVRFEEPYFGKGKLFVRD